MKKNSSVLKFRKLNKILIHNIVDKEVHKMSNKLERDLKEMMNVFSDPKYVRHAWKSVGQAILQNPAIKPVSQFDKDGNETLGSSIEKYSYNSLKRDLEKIGEANREPTELEMILQCQIVKAR